MGQSVFEQIQVDEKGLSFDTSLITWDTVPFTPDGKVDTELLKLNFLEDIFGRFHKATNEEIASVDASARLISLARQGMTDFIERAKEEMGPEGDLFDRLLSYIWNTYLSKVDINVQVIDFSNSQPNFQIYKEIHECIQKAKKSKDIRYWPFTTVEFENAEEF